MPSSSASLRSISRLKWPGGCTVRPRTTSQNPKFTYSVSAIDGHRLECRASAIPARKGQIHTGLMPISRWKNLEKLRRPRDRNVDVLNHLLGMDAGQPVELAA